MPTLTITADEVCKIGGLDPDTSDADEAQSVIDYEQAVWEAHIVASALADESLEPILRRGVAYLLAATTLDQISRTAPTNRAAIQASGVTTGASPNLAAEVRDLGMAMLHPYWIRRAATITPDVTAPSDEATQERAFGQSEFRRRQSDETDGW
jgi:hypothetical protein